MAKAKVNSGHGRRVAPKTSAPMKPSRVQLRSGFQPATSGLNTTPTRRAIPHDVSTSSSKTGSDLKLRLANVGTKRSGRRMY